MATVPGRLDVRAIAFLSVSGSSAALVAIDILALGRRQAMWIMDVVWPATALWSGPLGLCVYYQWGRAGETSAVTEARNRHEEPPSKRQPFPVLTAKGATHCGSGCTLGDIVAELFILVIPAVAVRQEDLRSVGIPLRLGVLARNRLPVFTIKPMRNLSLREGLKAALKADTLPLTAWQLGMYGWMAIATFTVFGHELSKASTRCSGS